MIPKECKRLAEVDFPIAVVSKHSAREKSIRHGHPSTLHLWWARRPLAACRAMLFELLLPDPCDSHCPESFKTKARDLLPKVQGKVGQSDKDLQQALLKFIGDFSNWDLSTNQAYLEVSRGLVKAAHPEETPLVVDPFAGGGSIPLEALRLGCEAFASDLNPVACLILKVMLEDIPRYGPELANELRRVGKEIKEAAEKELKEFYPDDPDGSKPIAYLWARTVRCEAPKCGAEIPLVRSFWLCKKPNRERALRYKVVYHKGGNHTPPSVEFEVFKPKSNSEVSLGSVTHAKATCLCCGSVLPPERIRAQLITQHGGADVIFDERGCRTGGAVLLVVIGHKPKEQGRHYRPATRHDYEALWKAQNVLQQIFTRKLPDGRSLVPDEDLPRERMKGNSGFRTLLYGINTFGDLFSARQKLALAVVGGTVRRHLAGRTVDDGVSNTLGLAVTRLADYTSGQCVWHIPKQLVAHTFGRQALPITWDFCEIAPLSEAPGNFSGAIDWIRKVIENVRDVKRGQVQQADARQSPLPNETASVWFTDPPYYDAVAYGDLSDFFLVWLKRVLLGHPLLRDPFDSVNPLSPKSEEIIQDPGRKIFGKVKDRDFYESSMATVFGDGRRILQEDGVGCVVFAHKTTEGWEALLSGMVNGGWTITGSWPIATEMGARLVARESAALATSIHLVCRARPKDAPVGDWDGVLHELPKRVGHWIERLQSEGIRGADLVFACIGPALEIFSRYSKVETAEGREVGLSEFLEKVWEVVGRTALEQVLGTAEAKARNSTAGALEEDARLTALFLWTLQSTNGESPSPQPSPTKGRGEEVAEEEEGEEEGTPKKKKQGYSLIFDVVRRFAQPLGIHLPQWEGRIIETRKGVVRLLSVKERAKQLFGEENVQTFAEQFERAPAGSLQLKLFPEVEKDSAPRIKGHKGRKKFTKIISDEGLKSRQEATTLDRIHAAMLLQSSGRTNALRALLKTEQDRGPDFLRLANALSALYPKGSEEKRLLDAMLLAVPR